MKQIVFVAMPDARVLDVAGPYQIFIRAAELSKGRLPYVVRMATTTPSGSIRTNCHLVLGGGAHYRVRIDPAIAPVISPHRADSPSRVSTSIHRGFLTCNAENC